MNHIIEDILNELNQLKDQGEFIKIVRGLRSQCNPFAEPLEAFTEDEQVLRLTCYLQEVRDRLENNLREQKAFVQEAVSLIKALSYVSGKFAKHSPPKQASSIQRLILGFETLSTSQNPSVSQDKALLKEFAQVRESKILRESLQTCKQTRDKLTKVLDLHKDKATQTNVDKSSSDSVCVIKARFASK